MHRIDYMKLDVWIKKNPEKHYKDFIKSPNKIQVSDWSFRKRRAKVLGLNMTPSMREDYRPSKANGKMTSGRSRSQYRVIFSKPFETFKKMDGVEGLAEALMLLNRHFRLGLEYARVKSFGSDVEQIEVRRSYTRE